MSYITADEYLEFTGVNAPDEFRALSDIASDQINALCGWKIRGSLDGLNDFSQTQVKRAVCAQVQWIDEHGGLSSLASGDADSMTLGKFSYSAPAGGAETTGGVSYSPLAAMYLAPTGLLYTAVKRR